MFFNHICVRIKTSLHEENELATLVSNKLILFFHLTTYQIKPRIDQLEFINLMLLRLPTNMDECI